MAGCAVTRLLGGINLSETFTCYPTDLKSLLFSSKIWAQYFARESGSAAQCQFFKFYSISDLSNLFFDIIGLAQTSQEYHQKFLRNDEKLQFLHKFHQNVIQYLKNQTDFWRFRYSMSIVDVIQCWFKHYS